MRLQKGQMVSGYNSSQNCNSLRIVLTNGFYKDSIPQPVPPDTKLKFDNNGEGNTRLADIGARTRMVDSKSSSSHNTSKDDVCLNAILQQIPLP